MRALFMFIAWLWMLWGSLSAGSTIFLWLSSWDVTAAYGVSLLGMVPIFGQVAASFMAPEIWGMSVPYALGEFAGGYVLFAFLAVLHRGSEERKRAEAGAKIGKLTRPGEGSPPVAE